MASHKGVAFRDQHMQYTEISGGERGGHAEGRLIHARGASATRAGICDAYARGQRGACIAKVYYRYHRERSDQSEEREKIEALCVREPR